MAMKWIACVVALATLNCLTDAQFFSQKPQQPPQQVHHPMPPPPPPPQPQRPQPPPPQRPQQPPKQVPQQPPKQIPQQPPKQLPQQPPKQIPQQPPKQLPQQPPKQVPQQPPQPPVFQPPKQQQNQYNPPTSQKVHHPAPDTFHSCEVEENYKIQCGPAGISSEHCSQINCCFDGQMCYYGKAVTVQCTMDGHFIVVAARDATLPSIDLDAIALLGSGTRCTPVAHSSRYVIYHFAVTDCGTTFTEEPGVLIYENRVSSSYEVAIGPDGVITRDTTYELLFQCRYIGTSIETLVIQVNLVPPPLPIAAPGPLRVELKLGSGQCLVKGCFEDDVAYDTFYGDADYPVTKVLREDVYVQVNMLERTDPNIVLTLGRCWATKSSNPHSVPQWDILVDGCPYRDDPYQSRVIPVGASSGLEFPSHHKRFAFKMFAFVDQTTMAPMKDTVFIHCNAAVCQPSSGDSCEPRCYRKKRDLNIVGKKHAREDTVIASSGQLFFVPSETSF